MDILVKAVGAVKLIGFIVGGLYYGYRHGFNDYSHDFDANIDSLVGFSIGACVGVDAILKNYGVTTILDLFALSVFAFFAVITKSATTIVFSYYFTKFLKNPQPIIDWAKSKRVWRKR